MKFLVRSCTTTNENAVRIWEGLKGMKMYLGKQGKVGAGRWRAGREPFVRSQKVKPESKSRKAITPKRRRYGGRLGQGEPKAELSDDDRSLAGVGFPRTFVDVIKTKTVVAFPFVVKDDIGCNETNR